MFLNYLKQDVWRNKRQEKMQSISISKLFFFLQKNEIIIKRFYRYNGKIVFIECILQTQGQLFCIYIEPSYNVVIDANISSIKSVEIQKEEIPSFQDDRIIEYPDTVDLQKGWNDLHIDIDEGGIGMSEKELTDGYDVEINHDENSFKILSDCYRQMQRYKLCVKSLEYKVCFFKDDIILNVSFVSNKIQYWRIVPYQKNDQTLMIVTPLDKVYSDISKIKKDIVKIETGIIQNLEYNQIKQTRNINKLLLHNSNLFEYYKKIELKRSKLNEVTGRLRLLMKKTLTSKQIVENNINVIKERRADNKAIGRGWKQDIDEIDQLSFLQSKLNRIIHVERELQDKYKRVWCDYQNLLLESDRILFDGGVIISQLIRNFDILKKISV